MSPAVLLYTWLRSSAKQAFWQGLLFGLGFFIVGTYWIFISINVYGNTPFFISVIITALFMLILSLYPATQGYLFVKLFAKKNIAVNCLLVFPAMWVLWEWLRGTLFSGFPWLYLGYSQLSTPLHGLAPLFGVYGISLVVSFVSGILNLLILKQHHRMKTIAVICFFSIFIVSWILADHQWTKPIGKPLQVSLVQGNIAQKIKWQPGDFLSIVKTYTDLTEANWNSQLIVWPEAAIPAYAYEVKNYLKFISQQAQAHETYLLLGILFQNQTTQQYYNGMIMLGKGHGRYLKRHLVPFGEYLPLKTLFNWFINYFHIPMSSFSAGPVQQPAITLNHADIATFICYEIAFPDLVLNSMQNRELIVSVSDDSWFGKSIALPQQVEMAQMRSLEMGRYSLYCANTGITAIINPLGQFIAKAPQNVKYVLTDQVKMMQGKTPLMRWGYYPVAGFILLFLLFGFFLPKSRKK